MNISSLLSDDQDSATVEKILPKVRELLTRDEAITYIAVQKKPVVNLSPDAIVLTNKRFMAIRPKMFGMTFEDFPWRDVKDVHLSEQFLGATITCRTVAGKVTLIDSIPKKQARRVYTFAQEVEEQAHQTRRQTELESLRASASNVTVSAGTAGGTAQPAFDPVQALTKLKTLLDAQLITEAEYAAKKGEILSKM